MSQSHVDSVVAISTCGWQHTPKCFYVDIYKMGFTSRQFHQGTRLRKQNVDYAAFIIKTNNQQ